MYKYIIDIITGLVDFRASGGLSLVNLTTEYSITWKVHTMAHTCMYARLHLTILNPRGYTTKLVCGS